MNKRFIFIQIFFLIVLIPQFLFSQIGKMPNISVLPLENKEKDLQIEVISSNIQKTIEFNLKMINRYNIIKNSVTDYSSNTSWISDYCEKNKIDDLIFGKALVQPNGSVFIEMSVFDKQKGMISLTKSETAATVLDIFNASDKLAIEIMDSFSGMHLGFGALKFINSGEKGTYSVYIDNLHIGENIDNLSTVLNGSREIIITQVRMFGDIKVYEKTINIPEDKTIEINFTIPGFLEKESSSVAKHESIIEDNWDEKYSGKKIDKSFNELFKLLNIVEYSQTAINKKKEVEDKFAQWNAKKASMGITRGLSILDKHVGISVYGAFNILASDFNEKDHSFQGEDTTNITPKAGVAVSINLLSRLALQSEFAVSQVYTRYKYDMSYPSPIEERIADFGIYEIPILLVFRVSPDKVFSLYAGGVIQIRMEGSNIRNKNSDSTENNEPTMPINKYNRAFAAGALFEIPLVSSLFLSFDVRYMKPVDSWIGNASGKSSADSELNLNCFHIAIGLGVKLF